MNELDIKGMTFTVSKSGSGGGGGSNLELASDEWYPCKLTEIKIVQRPGMPSKGIPPGPGLAWSFELIGDQYAYEYEGEKRQNRVIGQTSLKFSSHPTLPSTFYTWYCKLTGSVPVENSQLTGEEIISQLVGMDVAIMVKAKPGKDKQGNPKTWYNVERVKPFNPGKATPTPTVAKQAEAIKQTVTSKPMPKVTPQVAKVVVNTSSANPKGVTSPEEIPDDAVGVEEGDLYKDVF